MVTGVKGIELIKRFEGCKLTAYLCPAQIPTIGYGHTGADVKLGMTITNEQATQLLVKDLQKFEKSLNGYNLQLTQNQFDALISLIYNIGPGNFAKSSLLKKASINPNDATIEASFMAWNKGGGKVLQGLVARRQAEWEVYRS